MPTYSLINNGDSGLSVRTNLNEIIGDINTGTIGAAGTSGSSGTSGTSGVNGETGATGSAGPAGLVNGTGLYSLKQDNALTLLPATASGQDSWAIGSGAQALGLYSIAVGPKALCSASKAIAIGGQDSLSAASTYGAEATGPMNIAIGSYRSQAGGAAKATGGAGTNENNGGAIAIGTGALASGIRSLYIGSAIEGQAGGSGASGLHSLALGNGYVGLRASNTGSIIIGGNTRNINPLSLNPSISSGQYSIVIGHNSKATADGAIAIGGSGHQGSADPTTASASNSIAIGALSRALQSGSVAIGATVSANIVDTVSMRALELITQTATASGGIIMYDTNNSSYRLNVSTSGELRLNNKVVGPTTQYSSRSSNLDATTGGAATGMTFSYEVGGLYQIEIPFIYQSNSTTNSAAFSFELTQPITRYFMSISFTGAADDGGSIDIMTSVINSGATNSQTINYSGNIAYNNSNTSLTGKASGLFQAGATAGVAELIWYEDAGNVVLETGSTLIIRKLN